MMWKTRLISGRKNQRLSADKIATRMRRKRIMAMKKMIMGSKTMMMIVESHTDCKTKCTALSGNSKMIKTVARRSLKTK